MRPRKPLTPAQEERAANAKAARTAVAAKCRGSLANQLLNAKGIAGNPDMLYVPAITSKPLADVLVEAEHLSAKLLRCVVGTDPWVPTLGQEKIAVCKKMSVASKHVALTLAALSKRRKT